MLSVLQKEYTIDLSEFTKWQEMIRFRNTCMGRLSYLIGQVIAISFIIRLGLSAKQIVSPNYGDETIGKALRQILTWLGLMDHNEDSTGSDELVFKVSI